MQPTSPGAPTGEHSLRSRLLWMLLAPAICLAAYWRVPFIWFRADDFAWLSLGDVARESGLTEALFNPGAQGTIRVLSERLYFLILSELFGITSWPFRLIALGTFCLAILLIQILGERLTGSRTAAFWAALLWGISPRLVTPIDWSSAFNELLLTVLVLGAFYARLRWLDTQQARWRWIEAGLFLTGFAVLELVIVYPAIVALHAVTDSQARKFWKSALWMWIPAIGFALLHLLVIPKTDNPIYQIIVDARLPGTLWTYLWLSVGRSWEDLGSGAPIFGFLIGTGWMAIAEWAALVSLTGFAVWKLARRQWLAGFFAGWFLLWLGPVLPLPNHITKYYVTIPLIGLAWLAGWGIDAAWRYRQRHSRALALRAAVILICGGYLAGSLVEIDILTNFHRFMNDRMRLLFRATQADLARDPARAVLFLGIGDETWFRGGFGPTMTRLAGVERPYLPPDARELDAFAEYDGVPSLGSTATGLQVLLQSGDLRVLEVHDAYVRDVTSSYAPVLAAEARVQQSGPVDVGIPGDARVGEGWYQIENGARWSSGHATLLIWAPSGAKELVASGFVPQNAFDAMPSPGPITVSISLDGVSLGKQSVTEAGPFELRYALPEELARDREVELALDVTPTFRTPGDERELGLVFGTFAME